MLAIDWPLLSMKHSRPIRSETLNNTRTTLAVTQRPGDTPRPLKQTPTKHISDIAIDQPHSTTDEHNTHSLTHPLNHHVRTYPSECTTTCAGACQTYGLILTRILSLTLTRTLMPYLCDPNPNPCVNRTAHAVKIFKYKRATLL